MAFLVMLFVFTLSANAGHEEGGIIISYKSLVALNGDSLEYEITVYSVYSTVTPIPIPSNASVNLSSGCFANAIYSLPRISNSTGGLLSLGSGNYCAPTVNINANSGLAMYRDTVILPGKCADFTFYIQGGFGRFNIFTNMAFNSDTHYFSTDLNNIDGPNSIPSFPLADLVQASCVLKPLNLYNFIESDDDSVVYSASVPTYISGSTISNFAFGVGYSQANPVNSTAGYSINPLTGKVQTELTSAGNYMIAIKFEEYRNDTSGATILVGEGRFLMRLIGSSNCNTVNFEIQHESQPNSDSLMCNSSVIRLETTRRIDKSSLTTSGSEFHINSKKQGTIVPLSATVLSDSVIVLTLPQAVSSNDTLQVWASNGSDGDVLFSVCGKEILANQDTLTFYTPQVIPVVAQFSYNSNLLSLTFNSTTVADSSAWDFGDGSSAVINTTNPTHIFTAPGSYNVTFWGYDDCSSDSITQTIWVCDSLTANFTFSQSADTLFYDGSSSVGGISYFWDFDDGDSATGTTGQHVFNSGGNFMVTLYAVNNCGDTVSFSQLVETCAIPSAKWTYTIVNTTANGMLVDFDGSASQNASRFVWDFGDGNKDSTSLIPTHLYVTPSLLYQVTLTVYNLCGDDSILSFRLDEIGLDEYASLATINLYPNPSSGIFQLTWESGRTAPDEILVYTLEGKEVAKQLISLKEKNQEKIQLDLSDEKAGMYLIILYANGEVIGSRKTQISK